MPCEKCYYYAELGKSICKKCSYRKGTTMDKVLELGKKYGVVVASVIVLGVVGAIVFATRKTDEYLEVATGTIETLTDDEE